MSDSFEVSIETEATKPDGTIKTVEDLLIECKVDTSVWTVTKCIVNKWDALRSKPEGTVVQPMFQVKAFLQRWPQLELAPAAGPAYLPVEPGNVLNVGSDVEIALFIPDFQLGYCWSEDYQYLDPFHDRRAIDVVLQAVYDLQPDHIFYLGDYLDLPEYSKFQKGIKGISFANTTQPAIEEGYYWLRKFREACYKANTRFIKGNHDVRLNKELKKINEELLFLRAAQELKPALAIETLLRFNELRITTNSDWDDPMWLWDEICVRHGTEYTNLNANKLEYSTVQGHCHDLVYDVKTSWGPQGRKELVMMSPGCLVRPDGPIPRFQKCVDWQQGLGIAYKPKTGGPVSMQIVPIHDGEMHLGTKRYTAQDYDILESQLRQATGIRQLDRKA